MVKVSIVTICFNSEKSIQKTFDSVRNQSYENIEYIVVDGGSSDGTVELIKQNSDITKWVSEKDKGISDAFNKGILMSTGEWVLLLNSDDELLPDVVSYVMEHAEPDVDIIHGNKIEHKFDGRYVQVKPKLDYEYLKKYGMCINHPGMFIRKSAYEKYGLYDLSYKCGMDRELVARMHTLGAKIQYIDLDIVLFSEGGVSTKSYYKYTIPEGLRTSFVYKPNILFLLYDYAKCCIIFFISVNYRKIKIRLNAKK